ncbi:MAG: GNAT family N-acetyltransferase [Halothermotrichaceae bacterium]
MMKIIKCKKEFIDQVAAIFVEAFADSIEFFVKPDKKTVEAFRDVFKLLLKTFPNSFFVAVDETDQVIGYIIVTSNIKKLWLQSIRTGFVFIAFFKWISGRYGISLKTALKVIHNKLHYIIFEESTENCAQILSIAVESKWQGRGLGKQLVSSGLDYLKKEGIKKVKLEVRPDNFPAKKIYESFGFKAVDKAEDLQGKWIIMKVNL